MLRGPAGGLPRQVRRDDFGVGRVDQAPPCLGDEAGCVVICRVVDEQAEVVVVCWLGEAIKQLFARRAQLATISDSSGSLI